jgi:hypothetical protein
MTPAQAVSRIVAIQPLPGSTDHNPSPPEHFLQQLQVGQTLTARVREQRAGLTRIDINGQTLTVRLSGSYPPGSELPLRFAGHHPDPHFVLAPRAPLTTSTAQLSPTARLLGALLQNLPEQQSATLTPASPLLETPPASTQSLSSALHSTISRSGLFYESHLRNWINGQDTVAGLLQEPQNQLPGANPASLRDATANALQTLIAQQLQVLDAPQLTWRGELWPGQRLDWRIQRDSSEDERPAAHPGVPEKPFWRSHLEIELPRLGKISLEIEGRSGERFRVRIQPQDAPTRSQLQAHLPQLMQTLVASGCPPDTLTVAPDGPR